MIAAIQRSGILFALASLIMLAAWCTWRDRPEVWAWTTAIVLLGHPIVLAVEFALMYSINRRSGTPLPTFIQMLKAWLHESASAFKVFAWRQPFRATAMADFEMQCGRAARGVVLIHGFACKRAIWNDWLERLRAQQVPVIAVNLEPPWAGIETYEPTLESAVQRLESMTGSAPIAVAHSMGGLAARHWFSGQLEPTRLHRLVTLGSPHHGTWLARFGLGRNVGQMRLGSVWLSDLAKRETDSHRARITSFYSHCDNIVFPSVTATLPGADNRHIAGCAHIQMIQHADSWRALQDLLDQNSSPRST